MLNARILQGSENNLSHVSHLNAFRPELLTIENTTQEKQKSKLGQVFRRGVTAASRRLRVITLDEFIKMMIDKNDYISIHCSKLSNLIQIRQRDLLQRRLRKMGQIQGCISAKKNCAGDTTVAVDRAFSFGMLCMLMAGMTSAAAVPTEFLEFATLSLVIAISVVFLCYHFFIAFEFGAKLPKLAP